MACHAWRQHLRNAGWRDTPAVGDTPAVRDTLADTKAAMVGTGMGGSGYSGAYEYNGTDGYKPEYNPDMEHGGYPDMGDGGYNHDGGMGGGMGTSGMMGAVARIQLFISAIMVHVSRGDYRSLRVPGCFPEEFNDSFRRFVKALLWRTSRVQEIPGYEGVSEEFVSNVQSLIKQFMSGAQPAIFNGKMPSMFDERMGQWIESRGGFNPMMPLPSDLLEGALQQVVNISKNFTVHEWESEPEMRNMSMRLFGKMAAALLKSEGVVGNVSQAVIQIHGLLATGELDEASGTPGMKLTNNDICKRMVEMAVKKDAGGSHTAMLVMRDGDVYSVRPSPLTNDMIWKKVVACQCNHGQSWAT